jgi:hypothetical protein
MDICLLQGLGFLYGDTEIYTRYVTDLKVSVADPGCLSRIPIQDVHPGYEFFPDPESKRFWIRIRIKEF